MHEPAFLLKTSDGDDDGGVAAQMQNKHELTHIRVGLHLIYLFSAILTA